MKVTFVSNYINHHQIPLAEELYRVLFEDYRFIQTEAMEEERVKMGWDAKTDRLPYLLKYYEKPEECKALIADSDIVVFGGTDDESYITDRLQSGKPVIRVSERLYRDGQWKAVSPRGLLKKYHDHTRYRKKEIYLLCNGAYVPSDFHIVRAYPGKMLRWGYFPPFIPHDVDKLMAKKKEKSVPRLLWSGRFLELKHPEYAVMAAERLKEEGLDFELVLIGDGECRERLQEQIREKKLQDCIRMPGFLRPEEVRKEMERADIFLFTSDYREGWGAVLNEAMNSGCAVVANVAAGATAYLVQHGENGYLYRNRNWDAFYEYVKLLLTNHEKREEIGRHAYETIATTWNAQVAAKRLLELCTRLLKGVGGDFPLSGPGSKAPVISPGNMYKYAIKSSISKEKQE